MLVITEFVKIDFVQSKSVITSLVKTEFDCAFKYYTFMNKVAFSNIQFDLYPNVVYMQNA